MTVENDEDRAEVERILNFALDFAVQCLERYNGFDPFGGVIGLDGDLRPFAAADESVDPEASDNPQDLRDLLVEGIGRHAASSRAVFYCTDGMAQNADDEPSLDAIILHVEHWRWGVSKLSMTYERKRVRVRRVETASC